MNWAWATSLDQVWRSPAFPMWLTLAAAGFFGVVAFVTLVRAEKSVANGALTVITLLAIGIAVASTIRSFGPRDWGASGEEFSHQSVNATLPAFYCIDDLAGEVVLAACEKALFGSPETVAAAVSYTASRITRLQSFGDLAAANKNMTPELQALRHSVERDRYGLVAHVLLVRDHCLPSECAVYASLADSHQITANMDERTYDILIARYAPSWNAPATLAAPAPLLSSSVPTGKPTNADFPTSASIPPVSIMNPEPGPKSASSTGAAAAPPRPASGAVASSAPASSGPAMAAAKKPPAAKPARAVAPVSISPAISAPTAENNGSLN